jgi:hypothetical protein
MHKVSRVVFVLLVVFCLSILTFSTVGAYYVGPTAPTWADPYVPETSTKYTSDVLTPVDLPGTEIADGGKIYPVGFNHELQFGGNGLEVSGLAAGKKVEACFDFPTYRYSWNGVIKQWNGTKWAALPTTITKTVDGTTATACTPKVGNGIYSLLIWYYGPVEPQVTEEPT